MIEEEWRTVIEDYCEVSSKGNIRSLDRDVFNSAQGVYHSRKGRPMTPTTTKGGYLGITLKFDGMVFQEAMHRVVANAFIPNPDNKPFVNHRDGDKKNNDVSNLEWCTAAENNLHACRTGLRKVGEYLNKSSKRKSLTNSLNTAAVGAT